MATINYAFKEISCKIVYYGCGLSGKTTNIQNIYSAIPSENRGELISLATEQDRTLFFDFLPLDLGQIKGYKTKFQLYTVPGQVHYSATRKLVLRGVDGVVFVADSLHDRLSENVESLEDLKINLLDYSYNLYEIPWVMQYNKRDMSPIREVEELERVLNEEKVPFFEAVATKGTGVKETLKTIVAMVLKKIKVSQNLESQNSTIKRSVHPVPQSLSSETVPSEPNTPSRVETAEDQLDAAHSQAPNPRMILNVRQRSDARWRGIKVGSGVIDILNTHTDQNESFQLTSNFKYFLLFKRLRSQEVFFERKESLLHENHMSEFDYFVSNKNGDPEGGIKVWIAKGSQRNVFVKIPWLGDELVLLPSGKTEVP